MTTIQMRAVTMALLNALAWGWGAGFTGHGGWAQTAPMVEPAGIAGLWESSEGLINVQQAGAEVFATYAQDNGTIKGSLEGPQLRGYWSKDNSPRRCDTPRDGRYHWGRLQLQFTGSTFTGQWSYCYDEPSMTWIGQRRGTFSGQELPVRTPAPPAEKSPARQGQAGLGSRSLVFTIVNYSGDCPGTFIGTVDQVSFLSTSAPPAPYQRVKITNLRTGGFTDREYDERRPRSESFSLGLSGSHSSRFLAVGNGRNDLNYAILNRQIGVVERGSFSLDINTQERRQERRFNYVQNDNYCEGERDLSPSLRTNTSRCRTGYYYNEKVGVCPDGSKQKLSRRKIFNY